MTYLLSSCALKPISLIFWLILVSIASSYNTSSIRSITLSPSLLSLSLKISYISKSLIRGIVLSYLIQYLLLLMPPVRSTTSRRHNKLMSLILFISEVMPSYFYCVKKGLLYVIIISPSSRQLLSCTKYTTVNMRSSYNIYLVSDAKYKHFIICLSCYIPYLIYFRVLDLICC